MDDLADSTGLDFCVGVAGYPEKHFEAPNLKTDIHYLKQKVDAGSDYVTTQMFYDNKHYFDFVKQCREGGIDVPIVPGLKIHSLGQTVAVHTASLLRQLPGRFCQRSAGKIPNMWLTWASNMPISQTRGLLEAGVNNVHFYVMNDAKSVAKVIDSVGL